MLFCLNLNLKKYLANFDENCKIYYNEVLVNEINGINSDSVVFMTICLRRHFFLGTGYRPNVSK